MQQKLHLILKKCIRTVGGAWVSTMLLFLFAVPVLAQTGNPYACAAHDQIQVGSSGTCVQALQWLLNTKMPDLRPPLAEDGTYTGPATDANTVAGRVKEWQRRSGLRCQEGITGPETWNSLIPGLNQAGGCANNPGPTPPTNGGAGCNKLQQNFSDFGGGTPGPLANNCYSAGGAVAKATTLAFTLVGILSVLFIVIGGYQYITSRGDEKRAGAGKKTILWALIGLVLVLLAYGIVTITTRLTTTSQLF
jgi:hypothetical protein